MFIAQTARRIVTQNRKLLSGILTASSASYFGLTFQRSRMFYSSTPHVVLDVGAACMPKRRRPTPHEQARVCEDCGEDAYFVAHSQSVYAFGVADGVGGWADVGVDPSLFSRQLMHNAKTIFDQHVASADTVEPTKHTPKWLLEKAYRKMVVNGEVKAGSSTACILMLHANQKKPLLLSANLGDSGFMIIRNGTVVFRSKEQQQPGHFNAPYQLAIVPQPSGGNYQNQPSEADEHIFDVQHGDYVVVATDGLFDNLYDSDIVSTVLKVQHEYRTNKWPEDSQMVKDMALAVVSFATDKSRDPNYLSPFASNARKYDLFARMSNFTGGKQDDITVVVGRVSTNKHITEDGKTGGTIISKL